jgi:glutamate racemase
MGEKDKMRTQPVGVFDSGMGGLTVLQAMRRLLPHEDMIYLGDTARLPFGTKSARTVTSYALQACSYLSNLGIKMLVVACNTASAVALDPLGTAFPRLAVQGVVGPGAEAACKATKNGHILVLGTESTVQGGAYQRAIARCRPDIRVQARACQVFVSLAEEGWVQGPVIEAAAVKYLGDFFGPDQISSPDCLLLGCTHFPVLAEAVRKSLGSRAPVLVDSAETTALAVRNTLHTLGIANSRPDFGKIRFCVTDGPDRFIRVGRIFLQESIDPQSVDVVDL